MHAIVIAGTHSGCGKTTITLGILAALKKKGYTVQPFKTGPDFIDTGLHRLVTGRISRNLDIWMCGKQYVADCFRKYSRGTDIAVIEGVMGMYDGTCSTADLAAALGLPVVLVIDAYGMAESAGAMVKGFLSYESVIRENGVLLNSPCPRIPPSLFPGIKGVIFNRIASDRHYRRVGESVRDVPVLGYLPRDLDFRIPHRHLGLVVAEENPFEPTEIDKLADAILEHIDIEAIARISNSNTLPRSGSQKRGEAAPASAVTIAVAYDKAFCFYYEDNLDLLREAGARIVYFSPLSDPEIPEGADALYIGGGYPELHAGELSGNRSMLESIRGFSEMGKPVYAECGGFMYLTEGIFDVENLFHPMVRVFPFKTRMKKGRAGLGYREAILKHDSVFGKKGSAIRGHEFHYSEVILPLKKGDFEDKLPGVQTIYSVKDADNNYIYDEGFRIKNTLGSYIHVHFGSNKSIAESLIQYLKGG